MKTALIGFGNIGTGVVDLLARRREAIGARLPRPIELARIVDMDTTRKRDVEYDPSIVTSDLDSVLDDKSIETVIELIGGYEPARTIVERALKAGKHVVTANKAMLAVHGGDLVRSAAPGAALLYEAAVCGGIPLIRTIQQGLGANEIRSVRGIINGTSNFILTSMESKGMTFKKALGEAQRLGYAEPDPTFDVDGTDAGHKIALLAAQCFGMDIRFSDVLVEGIQNLTPVDFSYAKELGLKIKLLGIAKCDGAGQPAEVRVSPTLLDEDRPLAGVSGVFNAVEIEGDPVGLTMFYGRGAGPNPTASSVVADLMALAGAQSRDECARMNTLRAPLGKKMIKPIAEIESEYYLRFQAPDRPGVMAGLSRALADQEISIKSIVQHAVEDQKDSVGLIIVTHKAKEGSVRKALDEIKRAKVMGGDAFVLRVEE